jgi:hypothetical protein
MHNQEYQLQAAADIDEVSHRFYSSIVLNNRSFNVNEGSPRMKYRYLDEFLVAVKEEIEALQNTTNTYEKRMNQFKKNHRLNDKSLLHP